MKTIKEIQVKSIITPSKLPSSDFVINPYVGCLHACVYCYACFMKRFTEHVEDWGKFVDVKINAPELILATSRKLNKYHGKAITFGSVTDVYQAVEKKYQLTRCILEKLIPFDINLGIMTKSDLVTRDIDLLQQFKNCTVTISLSTLDDNVRKLFEPCAPPVQNRIAALQALHRAKINTVLFIAPIFPDITLWQKLIEETKDFVDEYWFENLNLYPAIKQEVKMALDKIDPKLWWKYLKQYYVNNDFWSQEKRQIIEYCNQHNIKHGVYFHTLA